MTLRALVLFHQWEGEPDAVDATGIISEAVAETVDDAAIEEIWAAAKYTNGCSDAPAELFRTAWVSLTGAHGLFETPTVDAELLTDE